MAQFRDTWPALAPEWLTTGFAEKYMYTLELQRDILLDKMNQAIKIRWPGQGDASQLPYLAHDRQIFQGPNEPVDQFIQRLIGAFDAWGRAGSRVSVLEQLQAYLLGTYPNRTKQLPQAAIVGGSYPTVTQWDVIDVNTPSIALAGGFPAKTTVMPSNFNWDGKSVPWRSWLILYMALVPTSDLIGSAAATSTAAVGSYASPGQNVGGVWVPATSGTPVKSPWLTIRGLTDLGLNDIGSWFTLSGSSNPGNNGVLSDRRGHVGDVVRHREPRRRDLLIGLRFGERSSRLPVRLRHTTPGYPRPGYHKHSTGACISCRTWRRDPGITGQVYNAASFCPPVKSDSA